MEYRTVQGLSLRASVIGVGTWPLGGPAWVNGRAIGRGAIGFSAACRVVAAALDRGVTFFDTAALYGLGRAEDILGRALRRAPDAIVATKVGYQVDRRGRLRQNFSSSWITRSVDASLRRLRRDCLDILLLHSPPDDFPWQRFDVGVLEQLRRHGKIRLYGVSCRSIRGAERVLQSRFGSVIEVIYNAFDRRARQLFPLVRRRSIAVIARVPLASGFLTDHMLQDLPRFTADDVRCQLSEKEVRWRIKSARAVRRVGKLREPLAVTALRFSLSPTEITTVIPGVHSIAQLDENLVAAQRGPLSAPVLARIRAAVPRVYPNWLH